MGPLEVAADLESRPTMQAGKQELGINTNEVGNTADWPQEVCGA